MNVFSLFFWMQEAPSQTHCLLFKAEKNLICGSEFSSISHFNRLFRFKFSSGPGSSFTYFWLCYVYHVNFLLCCGQGETCITNDTVPLPLPCCLGQLSDCSLLVTVGHCAAELKPACALFIPCHHSHTSMISARKVFDLHTCREKEVR